MTDVKKIIHVGYYNGFLKIMTDVKCKINIKVFKRIPLQKIGDGW